jgi:phosphoribosylamine---glycine ligase
MKVLVIGGGGREHALCWKLAQSPLLEKLYCTPGNAGIARIAECVSGEPVEVARRLSADFVVVGPDNPLAEGIIDRLQEAGIPAFGPTRRAAQLEASKIFCKELLRKYSIPTGDFEAFDNAEGAKAYLNDRDDDAPIVVKADGLALGKGVVIAHTRDEAIAAVDHVLEMAGGKGRVLIEEFLTGEEVSLIALTDGETVLPLVPVQDHKRAGEGDTGPNTGGMGCYSPVPSFTDEMYEVAVSTILEPAVRALREEGIEYRGALYAGLMLTPGGPRVLEFNCRFGDPETQVSLPRMESDLLPLLLACSRHDASRGSGPALRDMTCEWRDEAAVCVVMASLGYPGAYRKGDVIIGLDEAQETGALVFHAGTTDHEGVTLTSSGRVLGVTALGADFLQAREHCYRAVEQIRFEGAHYRRDIGWRCL